ncbi:hypothetical protein OIU78_029649, partial [Salix suchowensis]
MDYGGRYSFSCGQGVKEVLKALTRSQEENGSTSNCSRNAYSVHNIAEGSFESPERPDIYDEDGQSSETVKKEICRNLDQELDLNLLNEDMNTSGDNPEH